MQNVLLIVGGVFLALLVLAILGAAGWVYYDLRRRHLVTIMSMEGLAKECDRVASSISKITEIPQFLSGLEKVAQDQVKQMIELSSLVNKFHISLFGPGGSKEKEDREAWKPYEDSSADDAWEVQKMVDNGISRSEAIERVAAMRMEAARKDLEEQGKSRFEQQARFRVK